MKVVLVVDPHNAGDGQASDAQAFRPFYVLLAVVAGLAVACGIVVKVVHSRGAVAITIFVLFAVAIVILGYSARRQRR